MEQKEHLRTDMQPEKLLRNKKRRRTLIATACLVLAAIGAGIGIFAIRKESSPYPVFHRVTSETIPEIPVESYSNGFPGEGRDYEKFGISFEAEVLRVFPDPYITLGSNGIRFGMVELLVKDVIVGENVPQVVYWILTKKQADGIHANQTVIYSGWQIGLEGLSLANVKTGRIESFGVTFNGLGAGSFLSFADENDPEIGNAKQRIRLKAEQVSSDLEYGRYRTVLSIASAKGELREALLEIANPEIGAFYVSSLPESERISGFWCYRFINGYRTDEEILVNASAGEVVYSDARYTAKDWFTLPNLKKLTKKIDIKNLEIPQKPDLMGDSRAFYKFNCSYRKVDGKIYGVIGLCWCDIKDSIFETVYHADPFSYKIYTPEGKFLDAKYGELNSVLRSTQ